MAWATMAMTFAITPTSSRLPSEIGLALQATPRATESTNPTSTGDSTTQDEPAEAITFARDIQPLLERSCIACHDDGSPDGSLAMTHLQPLLRGGETGRPAIVPGHSSDSLLFLAASGSSDDLHMPPLEERTKYPALTTQELDRLRRWIDEGALWPKGIRLSRAAY